MLTARQTVETYFLEARHMLLEIAALLDRYDAAAGRDRGAAVNGADGDAAEKLAALREALAVLASETCDGERATRLLELFARV